MRKQYVIVEAWVNDPGEGTPEHPIVLPDPEPQPPGVPTPPIYWPPTVWPPIGGGGGRPPIPPRPGLPPDWERPSLPPGWEPPSRPERPPEGWYPGRPSHPIYRPLPGRPVDPGWGVEEGGGGGGIPTHPWVPPEYRPEHPWVPPQRPTLPDPGDRFTIWPVVTVEDIGGHPDLPDMNEPGVWVRVAVSKAAPYPAYIPLEPAMRHRDGEYEPKPPVHGTPGTWVTVLYRDEICWAWVPDIEQPSVPDLPERPQRPGGTPEHPIAPGIPEREPK